ncbi:MAG: phosphopantetheine-binding protein [Lachnospiraceae bacterium]|nr:phosphopantetheine-binding protein [Lachnospiraceae bacterium]
MDEKLKEIIYSVVEDKDMEITEDSEFIDDLGLSSMEFFNLINLIENSYHIKISDRQIQELETVGDIIEIIEENE